MSDYIKSNIGSGYNSATNINTELGKIEAAIASKVDEEGGVMTGDLQMNSNDVLNAGQVSTNTLILDGVALNANNPINSDTTVTTTRIVATAGQTVFTVPSYSLGINAIQVFLNGVKLSVATDYAETNTTTITLTNGASVNDVFEALIGSTVTDANNYDSALVTYNQGGTGAVNTNVRAKLQETVSVKDFGAVGDGVTDDTSAIQAAIDTLISRENCSLFIPKGVYNFTYLRLYDPSENLGRRGNFTIYGEGRENPLRGLESTTVLNCTSTSGVGLDINTVSDRNTPFNESQNYITLRDFNVVGNMDGTGILVKAEMVVLNSLIENINILNEGTGTALSRWSCYTTEFKNMVIMGDRSLADGSRVGKGIFHDTERSVGGMGRDTNVTVDAFSIGIEYDRSVANDGVVSSSTFNSLQCTGNDTNIIFGYGCHITATDCFFELGYTDNVVVKDNAKVTFLAGKIVASSTTSSFTILNGDSTEIYGTSGVAGARLSLENCVIQGSSSSSIPVFKMNESTDEAIYSVVSLRNCDLRSFNSQIFDEPSVPTYIGWIVLNETILKGIGETSSSYANSSTSFDSACSGVTIEYENSTGTLDLSGKISLPKIIYANTLSADVTVQLPLAGNDKSNFIGDTLKIVKPFSGNNVVLDFGASVNVIENGSSVTVSSITIAPVAYVEITAYDRGSSIFWVVEY